MFDTQLSHTKTQKKLAMQPTLQYRHIKLNIAKYPTVQCFSPIPPATPPHTQLDTTVSNDATAASAGVVVF